MYAALRACMSHKVRHPDEVTSDVFNMDSVSTWFDYCTPYDMVPSRARRISGNPWPAQHLGNMSWIRKSYGSKYIWSSKCEPLLEIVDISPLSIHSILKLLHSRIKVLVMLWRPQLALAGLCLGAKTEMEKKRKQRVRPWTNPVGNRLFGELNSSRSPGLDFVSDNQLIAPCMVSSFVRWMQ